VMSRRNGQPSDRFVEMLSGPAATLAFFASIAAFSAHHTLPENAAESAFLGLLVTVILASLSFVESPPHRLVAAIALLSAFALWTLPAGGARGATVSFVLTGGLGLAAWENVRRHAGLKRPASLVALAISAQALFRPEAWLAPSWSWAFVFEAILLPLMAGLGSAELIRDRGRLQLLAVALLVAFQRGVSPELALALGVACSARAGLENRSSAFAWGSLTIAVLLSSYNQLAALLVPGHGWRDIASGLAWLPLLAPSAIAPRRDGRAPWLASSCLAAGGFWLLSPEAALVLALPFLSNALASTRREGQLQTVWSVALLAGSALAAGYPWLRPRPIETALSVIGLDATWPNAVVLVLVFWSGVLALRIWTRIRPTRPGTARPDRRAICLTVATLLAVAALTVLPPFTGLLSEPIVITAAQPRFELAIRSTVRTVAVDSYVSNAILVPHRTPLAVLTIEDRDGVSDMIVLRSGVETGEWAARRPGSQIAAPTPWISWPAPGSSYFAQRYRSLHVFESPLEATVFKVRRMDGLPPELELAILQVGAQP